MDRYLTWSVERLSDDDIEKLKRQMSQPGKIQVVPCESVKGGGLVQELVILGELPDLNTYIDAERGHKMAAASLKKKAEKLVVGHILRCGIRPVEKLPAKLSYTWVCKDRRKDKDNVMFAQKFIQDALVRAGILENDGWKHVGSVEHHFGIDKDNPRVIVEIY